LLPSVGIAIQIQKDIADIILEIGVGCAAGELGFYGNGAVGIRFINLFY
jgi:hypothetical protein